RAGVRRWHARRDLRRSAGHLRPRRLVAHQRGLRRSPRPDHPVALDRAPVLAGQARIGAGEVGSGRSGALAALRDRAELRKLLGNALRALDERKELGRRLEPLVPDLIRGSELELLELPVKLSLAVLGVAHRLVACEELEDSEKADLFV